MILRQPTIKYKGYDPEDLSYGSHKKVCVSCDSCGRIGYIDFCMYRNLCGSCAQTLRYKNNIHPMKDKHHSLKSKIQMTKSHIGTTQSEKTKRKRSKSMSGENNPNYNKHQSEKTKQKNREAHIGKMVGKDNPQWKGGYDNLRPYLVSKNQCIQLNTYFVGSHFHHIMSGVGIYIFKNIHKMNHSIKNNKNMNIINDLAFNYLMGEY